MDIIVLFFVWILRTYCDLSIVISFVIVDSDNELLGRRIFAIFGAHVCGTFFPLLRRTIQFVQGGADDIDSSGHSSKSGTFFPFDVMVHKGELNFHDGATKSAFVIFGFDDLFVFAICGYGKDLVTLCNSVTFWDAAIRDMPGTDVECVFGTL
jgi:hypothetical protein